MENNIIFGLALNTALLLALVVLYETIPLHKTIRSRVMEVFTGILVGSIGIMVMLTPWRFSEGVVFDTRSILISTTGLFFGGIPTFITVLMTASLRIYQGGAGAVMGVAVIVTSAGLGLFWRYFLKFKKKTPLWHELYAFGIIVHLTMLGCAVFLPHEIRRNVLTTIALPVMLIYPAGTVLLGLTLLRRNQRMLLEQELRASEARLLAAERIAKLGNWDHDVLTGKLIWSEEIFNIFELDPKQFDSTYEAFLRAIHPQDRELVNQAYTTSLATRQPYRVTHRLLMPDGRVKYVHERSETFYDEDSKPLRSIGTVQDITERKRAEDEIRQLNASLEQRVEERTIQLREAQEQLVRQEKLAILGQLAGGVGHELRNPLGVISNAIYFLKMTQSGAGEKVKEYLDLIEQQIHISNKIISDLLDFTHANTAERAPVSVADVIQRTLERCPAPEHIHVEIDLPADLPRIHVDSPQVIQALGNLAINAYQSMPAESQENRFTISASARGGAVCITMQDTGCGISPEDLQKIFEPLFTTKLKGIGLGLAVAKKLLQTNDGNIEVQSEIGKGSAFRVCLPVYAETK